MPEKTKLDPQYIMNLEPGKELNDLVTATLDDIGVGEDTSQEWSNNHLARVNLLDIIDQMEIVGILLGGTDAPAIIRHMATVGSVTVYTTDWGESLTKSFLLYMNDHRGDFFHPNWEKAMNESPKRPEVLQ